MPDIDDGADPYPGGNARPVASGVSGEVKGSWTEDNALRRPMLHRTLSHRDGCLLRSYLWKLCMKGRPICHMMSNKLVSSLECKFNVTFNALSYLTGMHRKVTNSPNGTLQRSGNRVPTHDAFFASHHRIQ